MSTRERWIVYPLLFLALGTAVKPKLVPAERVTCRTLEVVGDDLRTRIRMTAATGSDNAEIRIANRSGNSVVILRADAATQGGLIGTLDNNGQVQTAMTSSAGGGAGEIKVNNRRGRPVVLLRADAATRAGLIETISDEGKLQTAMMSSATGGEIVAIDHDERNTGIIGHRDGRFGIIETDFGGSFSFVPIAKLAALSKLVP